MPRHPELESGQRQPWMCQRHLWQGYWSDPWARIDALHGYEPWREAEARDREVQVTAGACGDSGSGVWLRTAGDGREQLQRAGAERQGSWGRKLRRAGVANGRGEV